MAAPRTSVEGRFTDIEEQMRAEFQQRSGLGSTADAVHRAVVESIANGWLAPGTRLGEEYLAALFSVSRTPIREALMRLEAEQLAERDKHRGLVVGRITSQQIIELYVVREALDGAAARLAALQAQQLDIHQMEQTNDLMRQAAVEQRYTDMADMNVQFHTILARASRNEMLERFVGQIHGYVRRFVTTTFTYPDRAHSAIEEHDNIIAAIKARDPDDAERIAREHMRHAMEIRIKLEASEPSPQP